MTLLPRTLARFRKDFPQINVMRKEIESNDVIKEVEQNKVDLGLITLVNSIGDKLPDHITFQSFRDQGNINIIVPNNLELALSKELQLSDLKDHPLFVYDRSFYNNLIDDYTKIYWPLNIIFKTTNSEVVKKTVAEGWGIGLMTSLMIKDDPYLESGRITAIPLAYPYNFNLLVGGIYLKNRSQYRSIKKFLKYVEI